MYLGTSTVTISVALVCRRGRQPLVALSGVTPTLLASTLSEHVSDEGQPPVRRLCRPSRSWAQLGLGRSQRRHGNASACHQMQKHWRSEWRFGPHNVASNTRNDRCKVHMESSEQSASKGWHRRSRDGDKNLSLTTTAPLRREGFKTKAIQQHVSVQKVQRYQMVPGPDTRERSCNVFLWMRYYVARCPELVVMW